VVERVLLIQGVGANVELSLVVTGQEKVQELNRRYRGEDKPTDVLSFYLTPAVEDARSFVAPPDGLCHLGEVLISYPQAVVQAQEHRHSINRELAILVVHGVLHLLGCDHDNPEAGRQMKEKEKEILSQIPD
jgi:probable rRNA maturation factor